MKKTITRLIALTLVLVLTLSLFAGCEGSVKTSDEYLLSEYGMTFSDSSFTYDGQAHTAEVSVDSSLASGKSYTVTYVYEKDGNVIDASQVIDAGTYEVIATISDGSDTEYYLTSDLTIAKASLSVTVPDQYVRTGSDADDCDDVFTNLTLYGSDTVSSIGMTWDVDDIDDISAMTLLSEGVALGVEITSENYTLSVTKGTLYVLSYADYTKVGTLALDVSNLTAYNERFDELTYTENKSYSSAASRVLDIINNADDYTEVQLSMLGDINESTLTTNQALADKRTSQSYSVDWEVEGDIKASSLTPSSDTKAFEAIMTAYASSNDWYSSGTTLMTSSEQMKVWDEDQEDENDYEYEDRFYFKDEVLIDYEDRDDEEEYDDYKGEVIYGDYFYFVIVDYNENTTGDYIIDTITVRNKEYDYEDGKQVTVDSVKYRVYEFRLDSTTLGAIGTNSSVDITVNAVSKFYVNTIDLTDEDNDYISLLYIEDSDGADVMYYSSGGTNEAGGTVKGTLGYFIEGEEYELYITMQSGFTVSTITIGDDFVIEGTELEDGYSFTFTASEDLFGNDAGDKMDIVVETVKSFDYSLKINSRTVRYSDGTYEADDGTVVIDGLSADGTSAYITEGDELSFQFIPADDFYVTNVQFYFDSVYITTRDDFVYDSYSSGAEYAGAYIDLIDEVSSDGKITIDFSDDCDYFNFEYVEDATEITLYVTFAEKYEFEVVSDDVTFKQNSAGEWVSDYAVISILDVDEDILENIAKGELYTIYAELEPGYIISKLKVNGTTYTQSVTSSNALTTYAYDTIDDNEMYFFATTSYNSSSPSFKTINSLSTYESIYFNSSNYRIDAGEAIEIEIEFEMYYELEIDDNLQRNYSSAEISSDDDLYSFDGNYVIFTDDEDTDLDITITLTNDWYEYYYEDHTGQKYGSYNNDEDDDDNIDEVVFWLEVEGEELESWAISSSKFDKESDLVSPTLTKILSVEFSDLFDLVEAGDVIVIYVEYEVYDN